MARRDHATMGAVSRSKVVGRLQAERPIAIVGEARMISLGTTLVAVAAAITTLALAELAFARWERRRPAVQHRLDPLLDHDD